MKVKALLYCTKAKPYLTRNESDKTWYIMQQFELDTFKNVRTYNGTIPCECEIEVEKISNHISNGNWKYETLFVDEKELLVESGLDYEQLYNYLQGKNGYALHISNLKVFDKPRELSEYCRYDYPTFDKNDIVKTAPQNMCRVLTRNGYAYILISIQPQWLCKILNGEKDIEIRKQVLNCMKG